MDLIYKEVYFDQYCPKCKYNTLSESNDPCHDCLNYGYNKNSHKPVNFEGVDNDVSKRSTKIQR